MDFDIRDIDWEFASLWSMFFAAFSLIAVIATLALWAIATQAIVYSIFPTVDAIEVGKLSASLLAIIINLGFSAGLIYVYVRQTGVLREQRSLSAEQTSIQERQQEIMEAEYIPEVSIEVAEIENDTVILNCSNEGTGLAKQFEVDVEFYVSTKPMDEPHEYDQGVELELLSNTSFSSMSEVPNYGEVTQVAHYTGSASTPRRPTDDDNLAGIRTEEILREQDADMFEFSVFFERFVEPGGNPANPDRLSFDDGIEALREEGIETLGFGISISYNDIFNDEVADEPLVSSWVDIREGTSVRELFETADNRGIFSHRMPIGDKGTVYRTGYYPYI